MAFGSESKPEIGSDFTINQYENASANYEKTGVDQVPFSLGLSGVLPFNIGSTVSKSAYTMTKGKQVSTE